MRITVFTPTYNRAYRIETLYRSLQQQSFRDFEWLVVDDGSTDETERLFEKWLEEKNDFLIRYFKTENGGKHRAVNCGLKEAVGELFYIVDSDDYLPNDALEMIDRVEKTIPFENKSAYAGVAGQKGFENNQAIGSTFEGEFLDITSLEREKYDIRGDKAEVFYTEILKQYPFPEFENERFITECVVWDKIAFAGYKLRFFNRPVMVCEYLEDGLSAKEHQLFLNNPKGYGLYLAQSGQYGKLRGLKKWETFYRYYMNLRDKNSFMQIAKNLCMNPLVLWCRFFGMKVFYKLYDR